MKRLHKKIGVGVLVAGLILGAGGVSKGSVAHADSYNDIEQRLLSKFDDNKQKKYDLQSIINIGRNIYQVVDVDGSDKNLKLSNRCSQLEVKDRDFMRAVRDGDLERIGLQRGGIYRLNVYDLDILIAVFPK